jgi:hypothetical protein
MHYGSADTAREQRDLSIEISRLNDEIQRLSLSPANEPRRALLQLERDELVKSTT